ncbi:hypothetical protein [Brevibacillus porteri]
MKVPRILHYPSNKWSMADWIIEHMDGEGWKNISYLDQSSCN